MKIDGKAIAEKILEDLTLKVELLKEKGIIPTLAIILIGDNPASVSYIKQKQKAGERIGVKLELHQVSGIMRQENLQKEINKYNKDTSIHGIIIQRPLPKNSEIDISVLNSVNPQKDVDGFVPGSLFEVPVAQAVMVLLSNVFSLIPNTNPIIPATSTGILKNNKRFINWLRSRNIVVIGRGETAGKPISESLIKRGCQVTVVHSQIKNPDDLIRSGDIVISCVGKSNIVRRDNIKKDAILLSVGLWKDDEGKLHGDYNEDDIGDFASFYTPTPGGIGPVNVACLMKNLVRSAENLSIAS